MDSNNIVVGSNTVDLNGNLQWNDNSGAIQYQTRDGYIPNPNSQYYSPWDWDWYYRQFYPVYYPVAYPAFTYTEDKVSKAFKIVQKLIEKKIVDKISVKEFIELVNTIAEIL